MAFAAAIPSIIGGIASIGGGLLARKNQPTETKQQRMTRKTADELLASLKGQGPFSNLFNTSEEAFQKSFVQPAQALFRNQIAPQIQQQFIASGQQRGTGMEDTLARAGVDLDQLLNQQFMNFQQGAQNRASGAIGNILGLGAGAPNQLTGGQATGQALQGYLASPAFGELLKQGFKSPAPASPAQVTPANNTYSSWQYYTPKGYARDISDVQHGVK